MLKLTGIKKTYVTGDTKVEALKGIDLEFRNNEFVSVLGHSGCGKTTLLNVIGGLDQYDEGDLEIKGVSTKKYKDGDWDTYRNHCIGFVFQSYNLIPHQTVLSNVELALTLSGVSKAERKKRATEALEKVGLGDQLNKKPNQMSGGQMQRVAIARALVNNPEILLADEPTGALDSDTSVQIMNLLKEIAADRLVIMVTHNPELAQEYSTRIVRLKDGLVVSDTDPYHAETVEESAEKTKEQKKQEKKESKKTSMSFFTALSLSLNNLMTKKVRTLLTSFAGSIGIIGIALILALSNGVQLYIESVQREALSSYPLTIESAGMDMNSALSMFSGKGEDGESIIKHGLDKVYSNTALSAMTEAFTAGYKENDLTKFKAFIDSEESGISQYVSAVQYTYASPINIYSADTSEGVNIVNPSPMMEMMQGMMGSTSDNSMLSSLTSDATYTTMTSYYNMWKELIDNQELLNSQYDVLAGNWPKAFNEVVLVVDKNNEVSELTLQALGLSKPTAMMEMYTAMQNGETYTPESVELSYEEVMDLKFKVVLSPNRFAYDEKEKQWVDMSDDEAFMKKAVAQGTDIKIVGIVRPAEGSVATMTGGSVGYLKSLVEYVVSNTDSCDLVKQQKAAPETDVFSGLPFPTEEETAKAEDEKAAEKTAEAKSETASETKVAATTEAKETEVFTTPTVAPIGKAGETPKTSFISANEDEIYAYIDENYTGEERDSMKRMTELFLKSSLSAAERKELIASLDEMIAGQSFEGYGNVTGQQAYTAIKLMSKQQKLDMLEKFIQAGATGTPAEEPAEGDKTEEPAALTEPEPEPEPEPVAKSYTEALSMLGVSDLATPLTVNIYPKNFESKDAITQIIENYNQKAEDEGREDDKIIYTDYIGLILSSVTKIVNIVSYVLIAFVAISLVVSSIMIGIITYISVLERTKEIGILRAIGASKHDISTVFNAETLIVGFVSGALGIGVTVLLIIPINLLLEHLTTLGAAASLPVNGAIILVVISMALTLISGLIPSRIAAKKDPVEALRTE